MDGIHIEGGCKHGIFQNLMGACHDDLLAFTTDDSLYGPISDMLAEGIFAEGCHSAVRMLSTGTPLKNIHIKDIYGSFYVYCVCITKYFEERPDKGIFENIVLENIFASFCDGTKDVPGHWAPFIQIGKNVHISNLTLQNIYREEKICPLPTLGIEKNAVIDNLTVNSAKQRNFTDKKIDFIMNEGTIKNLLLCAIDAGSPILSGNGITENTEKILCR